MTSKHLCIGCLVCDVKRGIRGRVISHGRKLIRCMTSDGRCFMATSADLVSPRQFAIQQMRKQNGSR